MTPRLLENWSLKAIVEILSKGLFETEEYDFKLTLPEAHQDLTLSVIDLLSSYQTASIMAEVKLLLAVLSFAMLGRAARMQHVTRSEGAVGAPVLVGKQKSKI